MSGREVMCLLVLFIVSSLVSASTEDKNPDSHSLSIENLQVKLTCPEKPWSWHMGRDQLKADGQTYHITTYGEKDNGLYFCNITKSPDKRYYFYTRIKVCDNCVELDMPMAAGILVGDILFTLGVILVVFLLAKRKAPPATPQRPAHARPTSAPAQDSNYQRLNPATRNTDVYAEAARKL